jgi:hypothetical protein
VLPRRLNTVPFLSMFCYESGFENYVPRRAAPDGCNIDDPKTLNNLIRVSKFYEPNPKYLELIQKNSFTIEMRKQLTEWMFEVCRSFSWLINDFHFAFTAACADSFFPQRIGRRPFCFWTSFRLFFRYCSLFVLSLAIASLRDLISSCSRWFVPFLYNCKIRIWLIEVPF